MSRQKKFYSLEEAADLIMADESDIELDQDVNGEIDIDEIKEHKDSNAIEILEVNERFEFDEFDVDLADTSVDAESGGIGDQIEYPLFNSKNEIEFVDQQNNYKITEKKDIAWRRRTFEPVPFIFQTAESPQASMESPLQIFEKYIPQQMYEEIALYTNMYAIQKGRSGFKHTTSSEIMKLFGIHLLMGVMKLPRCRMFWSRELQIQSIAPVMTRDRFFWLRSHIHFIDNETIPRDCTDKFIKTRPLINCVRRRCLELPVEETISVDEQIIPFKGQLNIKQYVKGKPCPWGLKVFVLCGKSGYPYDFILYQGAQTEISSFDRARVGLGAAVVLHLISRLKLPGHTLFFDNFFSSYQLFEILSQKQINAPGIVRTNRFNNPNFSTDAVLKKQGRGSAEEIVSRDGNIILVKWQDNRSVHLASNYCGIGQPEQVQRWDKKEKKYVQISQPKIVKEYNGGMGGVDLFDQYMSYYRIFIKSNKWTLRVMTHFIDVALCASYLEYKKQCEYNKLPINDTLSPIDFKLNVAHSLTNVQLHNRKRLNEDSELDLEF